MKDPWIWALSPERAENSPRFFLRFDTIETVRTCEVLGFRGGNSSLIFDEICPFSGKFPGFPVHIERTSVRPSPPPPFRQRMPREVQPTSRGLSFPHKLPQNRRVTAFHSAVLSVLQRKQKPLKKPKILRKSSRLFSAFQDPGPTPSLALKMQ